jgi:hypothetical protein
MCGAEGGLMVAHVHHGIPRCLLKVYDRAHGPGLEPADLADWFEWEEEAFRYVVDPDISREELIYRIEGSTVEIAGDVHRAVHSAAGDFTRWGQLGGLETLRRYGRPWFVLLGHRRWGRISADALTDYRAELTAKAGAA